VKVNYKISIFYRKAIGLISSSADNYHHWCLDFYHEKMSGGGGGEADRSSISGARKTHKDTETTFVRTD
jgi:hypothetical protein